MVAEKQNTEQMILEAAEAEFLEKGYNGTTTAAIAKRAGVTHAMLHYYFRTKENLFEVYLKKRIAMLKNALPLKLVSDDVSFAEKVRQLIALHIDFMIEHPELPEFAIKELLFASTERQDILRREMFGDERILQFRKEFEHEAACGNIRNIPFVEFLCEIIALDFSAVFVMRVLEKVLPGKDGEEMLDAKKTENYEIIMNKLKPVSR